MFANVRNHFLENLPTFQHYLFVKQRANATYFTPPEIVLKEVVSANADQNFNHRIATNAASVTMDTPNVDPAIVTPTALETTCVKLAAVSALASITTLVTTVTGALKDFIISPIACVSVKQ